MNKLSKLLLATTCLTAVSAGPAAAVSEIEPNNSFGAAQVVPLGTTQITGTLDSNFATNFFDFFRLDGLQPGGTFTVTLSVLTPAVEVGEQFMGALNTSQTLLDGSGLNDGDQLTGTIPGNGTIILEIEGFTDVEQVFSYALNISAPRVAGVPEPSVLSLLGAGAAGLGVGAIRGLWRKRPKR